jgi:hypothetical protein
MIDNVKSDDGKKVAISLDFNGSFNNCGEFGHM